MEYKEWNGQKISRLGMGNMRLPILPGQPDSMIDKEKAQAIIDYAMQQGINYYDTAYVYHSGKSEEFLGEALVDRYPRESFCLATKFFIMANPDYKAVFEEQLSRLHTEYIDFYLIHAVGDATAKQYIDSGAIEYFREQKKAGRIKYLGFSSHSSPEVLAMFADYEDWDFAQIQLNYFDWNYGTAKAEYEVLEQRGLPIIVMEPVRGGRLAKLTPETEAVLKEKQPSWSIPAWAFRWLKSLPQVQVVLSGMSAMEQIEDNIATFSDGKKISKEEETLLFEMCEKFHTQVRVPCTACRYCCDGCPAQINIPEVLKIYNDYKVDGKFALGRLEKVETKGQPADCIQCGACTSHCPQNIAIPEIMDELKGILQEA